VVTRHPGRLLAAVAAVVALLAVGLPLLEFQTGQDTMVDPGADVYRTNERYQATFGDFAAAQLDVAPDLIGAATERDAPAAAEAARSRAAAQGASAEEQDVAAATAEAELGAERAALVAT
jgi:uncharacterized membrane protein YdfJ with MMPL/SSD domain